MTVFPSDSGRRGHESSTRVKPHLAPIPTPPFSSIHSSRLPPSSISLFTVLCAITFPLVAAMSSLFLSCVDECFIVCSSFNWVNRCNLCSLKLSWDPWFKYSSPHHLSCSSPLHTSLRCATLDSRFPSPYPVYTFS